jgi:carboxyl-terminal processing protease
MMSFGNPLDGMILDNRMNEGGSDTVLSGTLAYFTHGNLGSFVSRKEERPFRVQNRDMLGSQKTPLIVLIGESTVSFGEIFAGILQNTGRAYLIGNTTLGNVEILWGYDFEDGSRAWIAHETFRPLHPAEADWETTGIIPDLSIPVNWDEVTLTTDPAVNAALDYFDR